MDNRYRPRSPPGRRYPTQDPRVSTGFISTSYEPSYSSYPRSAVEPYSQARHNSVYDPASVKRYGYTEPYGAPVIRTQYPAASFTRPRNNSAIAAENRRPVSMISSKNVSPPRYKPVVSNTARDGGRRSPPLNHAAVREDPGRYLVPARSTGSDHHQRHYSATRADVDRLIPAARGKRGEYHQAGGYSSSKGYGGTRGVKDDDFSYTGPREQFARDFPVRSPPPRDIPATRRERPVSVIEIPDHRAPPSRREMGPPPLPRQPDRLDLSRRSGYDDALDRPADLPSRRHSMRQPVVHQLRDEPYAARQDDVDRVISKPRRERFDDDDLVPRMRQRDLDAPYDRDLEYRRDRERDLELRDRDRDREKDYLKDRDRDIRERDVRDRDRDRDRDRERERDRDRDRDRERDRGDREKERTRHVERKDRQPEEEREHRGNDAGAEHSGAAKVAAAGLAGAATAGLASAVLKSKKSEDPSDSDERKERRRRHRHHDREERVSAPVEAESLPESQAKEQPSVLSDDSRHRDSGYGTSRREESGESHDDENGKRRRRRRHRDRDAEDEVADDAGLAPPSANPDRDVSPGDEGGGHRRRREKSRSDDRDAPAPDQRTISPGDEDDGRPRRVQLVEPEKKEEFRPRGILKPQRTTPFPEDPNPTREGVAPLKESGKQAQPGIPNGARWTKISRMLVNPEALEKYHERFEEREDYVIVLRVLTREEITKFAEKTQVIRAERERLWKEQVDQRRTAEAEGRHNGGHDSDDEADMARPTLDSKPAEPGMDPQTSIDAVPLVPISAPPVPAIKLEEVDTANYSTNV